MPSCDVLIRSYRGDFGWLGYCLRSLHRNLKGWRKIHVCVPNQDLYGVTHLTHETVHGIEERCEGYLDQQITKLHAHLYSDADYVLHVDSDCIFHRKCDISEMLDGEKAIVLREDGVESPWNKISERSLGWYDSAEYMRRMPIIYPRWAYPAFKAWMEERHGRELGNYIASQPYREFSEFNTMGQWLYQFHRDAISWKHPSELEPMCKQYWSWAGLDKHKDEVETIVSG